ncbi:hypothetical protein KAU33_05270 [Candidatus Dependentiae bacterium]|nr:hypothetical protein [Candidatus Dependentiae bacterium]
MEEEKQTIEEQEPIQDKKKKYKWLQWVILIFILIVYSAVGIPGMIYARKKAVLSSCSGNLRNLGIIITNYSTDQKGHYPQNLEELTKYAYIEELPVCPETGESYIYEISGWDDIGFTIWCPNSEKHVGSKGPTGRRAPKSLYYSAGAGVRNVDGG